MDIGGAVHATLDSMAFEGATKKNRPNLQVHVTMESFSNALSLSLVLPAKQC